MPAINPRLAIGVSQTPGSFDGTGVLSLCYGDPFITPPLNRVLLLDSPYSYFAVREVASPNAPRQFRRTGFGTALKFDIHIELETGWTGGGAYAAIWNDSAMFSLASILGLSAGGAQLSAPGAAFPNYLFVTTNYQTQFEQWIPVDLDPNNQTDTQTPFMFKTWVRGFDLAFISQQTYERIFRADVPSKNVQVGAGFITNLTNPTSSNPFLGTMTLSQPLSAGPVPPAINVGDAIMGFIQGNVFAPYRFIITSIDGTRKSIGIASYQSWVGGAYNAAYWTQQDDPFYRTPFYQFNAYNGPVPATGFNLLPNFCGVIGLTV
jgi:hypothetical protein